MRKTAIIAVVALGGAAAGYYLGGRHCEHLLRGAPFTFYVRDTWHDCRSIRELTKGNVADVLHDLNMNLNQQIIQLRLISRSAPAERDRRRALDLLLDIAQHRADFQLSPRDSKEGTTVHGILDEATAEAGKQAPSGQPDGVR